MGAHFPMGGSSLKRRAACPGSYGMEARVSYPELDSPAADRGTALHACMEEYFKGPVAGPGSESREAFGRVLAAAESMGIGTEENIRALSFCCSELAGIIPMGDVTFALETPLDVRWVHELCGDTTPDVVLVQEEAACVTDYKFGHGEVDDAERNYQLALYALGVTKKYPGVKTVTVWVLQPGLEKSDAFDIGLEGLAKALDNIRTIVGKAIKATADDLRQGPQCTYCKASEICPANNRSLVQASQSSLINNPEKVMELSETALVQWYKLVQKIKPISKRVDERVYQIRCAGGMVDVFDLVPGRETRQWKDDSEAADALTRKESENPEFWNKLVVSAPVSPAQVEAVLGKTKDTAALLKDLVVKVPGRKKVVLKE